jgi:two-component system NtrC family response regulator
MVPPRIIATTQYDLIAMVREKRFREDLYYRLNVMGISLPPLRERGSDILFLAETFLQQAKPDAPKRLSSGAAKALLDYPWPGNLWELQNLMYHLCVTTRAAVIEETDLSFGGRGAESGSAPAGDGNGVDYYASMAALEKQLLLHALTSAGGSRAEAARLLGINRQLLYAKLKSHGLMNELKD